MKGIIQPAKISGRRILLITCLLVLSGIGAIAQQKNQDLAKNISLGDSLFAKKLYKQARQKYIIAFEIDEECAKCELKIKACEKAINAVPVVKKRSSGKTVVDTVKVYVPVATKPDESKFNFFDDFSDNKNGWFVGSNAERDVSIVNGKMKLKEIANDSFFTLLKFNIDLTSAFDESVIVRWDDGVTDGHFGLIYCDNPSTNSLYIFTINANGEYALWYDENGGVWKNIKSAKSDYINQNSIPNILSIKKQAAYITFYINNHQVETFPFDGGYGKSFGLIVMGQQTVDFDNFSLSGTKE